MKQLFLNSTTIVLFLLIGFHFTNAQNLITGRVIDKATGKYIKDVSVTKVGTDFKTVTNALGFFQVEVTRLTKLQLSCDGYITKHVDISRNDNVTIEMERRQFIAGAPVEAPPTFPGGWPAFFEYIKKNIDAPHDVPKGTVKVELVISPTGEVVKDSVKIIQSLCKPCDKEALRIMKRSPKWNPGEHRNNVRFVVPITFN
jgi:hypothetical protein